MRYNMRLASSVRQKLPLVKMAALVLACGFCAQADDVGTVMPWDAPAPDRFIATPGYVDTPDFTNYYAGPTFPGDRLGDNGLGNLEAFYGSFFGSAFFGGDDGGDFSPQFDNDRPHRRPDRRPSQYGPSRPRPGHHGGRFRNR